MISLTRILPKKFRYLIIALSVTPFMRGKLPEFTWLWSVYPWLDGDKVIVSDIDHGLFILKVDSKK